MEPGPVERKGLQPSRRPRGRTVHDQVPVQGTFGIDHESTAGPPHEPHQAFDRALVGGAGKDRRGCLTSQKRRVGAAGRIVAAAAAGSADPAGMATSHRPTIADGPSVAVKGAPEG